MQDGLLNPCDPAAFRGSKLDWTERDRNPRLYNLYRDLIKLRREDPVLRRPQPHGVDGAVLFDRAFLLRYFDSRHGDRLLVFNFGIDLHFDPAPEPLLAPPLNRQWTVFWSSEHPRYGGTGTIPPDSDDNWRIPGNSAMLLIPGEALDNGLN
jgi:maltooligosyltrehalose trehalohydrolase